ncbi:hypothetical protein [Aureimonas mangrovi]|uniref:hypothetical protein n=1 Tax=Aureimonas mangrovi TaxID=2758041 RepID=UPI00163D6F6D|nr:hypothetical protein [Aureimonas mangrovi]
MPKNTRSIVLQAAMDGVQKAASSPSIQIDYPAIAPVANRVAAELTPIVDHLTNNEAWYRSRVTWGVLVAAVCTLVKPVTGELFDAAQTVEIVDALTSGGQLFGFGLTLYGRYIAKKPIGA